jgi:hypothetical protein
MLESQCSLEKPENNPLTFYMQVGYILFPDFIATQNLNEILELAVHRG